MPSDLKSFMSCQSQTISTQANKKGSNHDSETGMDVYSGVVDIHLNEYVPSEEGLRPFPEGRWSGQIIVEWDIWGRVYKAR